MSTRNKNNFRERCSQVDEGEILQNEVWYRSPLSSRDHLLGMERDHDEQEISWCGFSLGYCRDLPDLGDDDALGGLWVSDRKGGKCAECKRRQREFEEFVEHHGVHQ